MFEKCLDDFKTEKRDFQKIIHERDQYEGQLDEAGLKDIFDRVRAIFLQKAGMSGIEESPDSNDKKLIIMVPSTYVYQLSSLIYQVEQTVPEA